LADRTLQFLSKVTGRNVTAMCDALEILIALRFAELHDVAAHLTQSNASIRALAQSQPDQWAERLAQIGKFWDYQGSLPAEFAGFVAARK
jgi:hypothetical protein